MAKITPKLHILDIHVYKSQILLYNVG